MHETWLRPLLKWICKQCFGVKVLGLKHYLKVKGPAVIIANHQSFLDPFLLCVFLPETPTFAMNSFQAKKWYFKPFLKIVPVIELDPTEPHSLKELIRTLEEGKKIVIFPEGRITTTGGLMKIYEGTSLVLEKTSAPLLPIWIEGSKYSTFSKIGHLERARRFPRISMHISPARQLELPAELKGKALREHITRYLGDTLVECAFQAYGHRQPILKAFLQAAPLHGWGQFIMTDINRVELTYKQLYVRTCVLAQVLSRHLKQGKKTVSYQHKEDMQVRDAVGVLLPTSLAGVVSFFALHMLDRVPAMLNFSAGKKSLTQACEAANLKTIITSRTFIEKGNLEELIAHLKTDYTIVYLEDVRANIGIRDKLRGLFASKTPQYSFRKALAISADAPAAILFTSGSEGAPKGVALSHANILSNIAQARAAIPFTSSDRMFNALPIFHSFGLTVGSLLPLMVGIPTFLYPSPLHYRQIPELVYAFNTTILPGTDTFFNGWAKYAHGYDFYNIRLAVAGAEKLRDETRQLYADRFKVNILQGYGVTESSPAVSFNTPVNQVPGTVGRLLPMMEASIEPIEGLEKGGKLLLKGPNIMLGYMRNAKPGIIEKHEGWYDTGDIVDIDSDGYIRIQGRAKRFAKIGGEMVSLTVVEELAMRYWPEHGHTALIQPDERKGECIILVSECEALTRDSILDKAKQEGIAEIALPKKVIYIDTIPRLGSGKVDFVTLREWGEQNA